MIALTVALLAGSAVAAFIQSPIPPSSNENFFYDVDGDGRLDRMSIKFLGSIGRDYLDNMVDSLTFDWVDSSNALVHIKRFPADFVKDPAVNRRVYLNFRDVQQGFSKRTDVAYGNVHLYLKNGVVYPVNVKDGMRPVIKTALFKGNRSQSRDSLRITLTEEIVPEGSCANLFEFKSESRNDVAPLQAIESQWNETRTSVLFVLDGNGVQPLTPRDSVRLVADCVKDSVGNVVNATSHFAYVNGFYPLEFETGSMVISSSAGGAVDAPIFQLQFRSVGDAVPNEQEWGVAMDLLTPEFFNAVRDALRFGENTPVDLSKLRMQYNVKVYTSLGEYVVGTSADFYGNDKRFEQEPKRLFLKWNLMDGNRRLVGTGAYIANVSVLVTYEGNVVYRSDFQRGSSSRIFGVKRR